MILVGDRPRAAVATGPLTRPPLLYVASLLLGLGLDRLLPLPLHLPAAVPIRWAAGGALILIGLAIMATGTRNFSRAATPYRSNQPVRALVTTGIHGWSRNPIYVGMFLVYTGLGLGTRSPWALLLLLPLAITVRGVVVGREEAYLERHFGDAYRDYKERVRRWL